MSGPIQSRWWAEGRCFRSLVSAWVPCDPKACFDYLSDFNRHSEWATDEVRIKPVEPGPVAVGKRYHAVGVQGGKEWPADLIVTALEPPAVFEFTATGGPIPVPHDDPHRHRFTFTPEQVGTRIDLERWDPFPPKWPAWYRYWLVPLASVTAMPIRKKTLAYVARRLEQMARPAERHGR